MSGPSRGTRVCLPHLLAVLEVFLLTDVQQTLLLDLIVERFEAELGASGGQRLNNSEQAERITDVKGMLQHLLPRSDDEFTC